MEENTKRVIEIDIDLGASSDRLAEVNRDLDVLKKNTNELKKENSDLLEAYRKGEVEWSEVSKRVSENSKAIADNEAKSKQLRAEQSTLQGVIAETTKENRIYGDSFKELSAKLSDMKNAYRSLNKEQRESDGGKAMLKQIQDLDAEMKGADASIGNFQRNVGDYAGQISKIAGLFGSGKGAAGQFASGIAGVTQGFKAMTGVPVVAIIGAIIAIFQRLREALTKSEEQTMKWNEVLAAMRPLLDAVQNGITQFANVLIKVVNGAINVATAAMDGLARAADWVGRIFGANWGLSEKTSQLKANAAAQRDLVEAENEYVRHKREWSVESAKLDRDIADLREKATDKEKYSAKERLAFLDEAIALETKKAEKEKELAQENLRILQLEADRTANDAAMNDRLAEAERSVIEADKQLSDTKRNLSRQRQSAINEINSHTKATKKDTEAVKDNTEALARQNEEYRKKTLTEMQKAEDDINDIIVDAIEKRRAIENTQFARKGAQLTASMEAEREAHGESSALYQAYYLQLEALREKHEQTMAAISNDEIANEAKQAELEWQNRLEQASLNGENVEQMILDHYSDTLSSMTQIAGESDAEFYARRLEAQRAFNEQKQKLNDAEVEMEKAKANYLASIAGSISSLMESVAGENKEMVKASKIVALAEVAIKQGVAIAEAVASSAAGDPYTYALRVAAAIASTVAAMATAIQSINSVKLARGTSYVQGPGTETSDSVPAMLSKGEGVVNAKANRMFPGVVGAMNDASVGIWSPMMSMLRSSGGAPAQVASPMQMTEIQMANAFRNAVSDLDMYVSVEEINRGQRSVKVVENLGSV